MRNRTAIAVLAGVGLALGYVSTADAHHAVNAQFDVTKSVVITGTLVKVDWQNPHAWFWFDVKKSDGTTERWGTETVGPNGLRRIGPQRREFGKIRPRREIPTRSAQQHAAQVRRCRQERGRAGQPCAPARAPARLRPRPHPRARRWRSAAPPGSRRGPFPGRRPSGPMPCAPGRAWRQTRRRGHLDCAGRQSPNRAPWSSSG